MTKDALRLKWVEAELAAERERRRAEELEERVDGLERALESVAEAVSSLGFGLSGHSEVLERLTHMVEELAGCPRTH